MLANGHITCLLEERTKEEQQYYDRRISNMLTFKPDLTKIPETDIESTKSADIERIIALEVAEIVNRKSRLKKEKEEYDKEENIEINLESNSDDKLSSEESHLNSEFQQKSTQTDIYRSPADTLRRKSLQIVTRIFIKEDSENTLEDKRMDDQNSEGDCKASPLDVFRYPNIRKKFFILTFNWVALGVVYNSLSYNTPNLGVDDYLAFFIGKL